MENRMVGWGVAGHPVGEDAEVGGTVFGYADETAFVPSGSERRRVGSGILLTKKKIEPDLIDRAIDVLRSNPKASREDTRTLATGHFHASKDSWPARRALAQTIQTMVQGTVLYSYRDPEICPPLEPKNLETSHQNLAFLLSLLPVTSTRSVVNVMVEDRPGLGPIEQASWLDRLYRNIEHGVLDHPSIPALFPDIRITRGNKTDAGLQVVDLLLWALNRSEAVQTDDGSGRDSSQFLKELGLTPALGFRAGNAAFRSGQYYLGNEVPTVFIRYPAGLPVPETMGTNGEFHAWALIVETLWRAHEDGLPEHAAHLRDPLAKALHRLEDSDAAPEDQVIVTVASIFIRLFDTVPLYRTVPSDCSDQWTSFLFARRFASLVQRWDLVHGVRCLHAAIMWRHHAFQADE